MAKKPKEGEAKKNISGVNLLEGIDSKIVRRLSGKCTFNDHVCGELIIRKGDADTDVYFVLSGQVAVFNYVDTAAQVFLSEFFPGDMFGELAVIDGGVRSAWVVAVADSTVAVLPGAVFLKAVTSNSDITLNIMKHMSQIIRGTGARVRNLSLMTTRQRIAVEMIRLSGAGSRVTGAATIHEMPSHSALASYASCSRDAVSEILGELMRKKSIARKGRSILISELGDLRDMVDEGEYRKMDSEEGVSTLFKDIYMT